MGAGAGLGSGLPSPVGSGPTTISHRPPCSLTPLPFGFFPSSAMRKLMLEVIAFTLNTEQINGLRVIFEAMDEDKVS